MEITPQQARIELAKRELARRQSTKQTPQTQDFLTTSGVGSFPGIKQLNQFGVGVGTAIGKAGIGLGQAFLKGANVIGNVIGAPKNQYDPVIKGMEDIKQNIYQKPFEKELASVPGAVGTAVGTAAPYVATGGAVAGTRNAVTGLVRGTGFASGAARTALAATTEGTLNYGLTYGLTGGDKQQAAVSGVVSGILGGLFAGTGEVLKGVKADESLMNKIYKTDKKEQAKLLFGKEGAGKVEKTLAQEALDRGITGNVEQQAKQIGQGMVKSEQALGDALKEAGNPDITLKNPMKYVNALAKEAESFRKNGADLMADKIEQVASVIKDDGKIKSTDALVLRRMIDGFTNFRKGIVSEIKLSYEQAGFREMGNEIRAQIDNIKGVGEIMKDYQFFYEAKDKLIQYASRSANKESLDLFDKLLFGESLMAASPVGAGIGVARKAVTAVPATSAQFIKNLPTSSAGGAAARGITGRAVSSMTSSQ